MGIEFRASGSEKKEQAVDVLVMFAWLFIAANINQLLGLAYFCFLILFWVIREEGKLVVYPVTKGEIEKGWVAPAIIGILFTLGFLYVASSFLPGGAKVIGMALMQSLKLQNMHWTLAVLIGGIMVGYTEEKLFRGALLPYLKHWVGENSIINCGLSGAIFALWHIAVYSITNNPALLLAGVFGTTMSLVVWNREELKHAIIAHISFNSITILALYNLLPVAIMKTLGL